MDGTDNFEGISFLSPGLRAFYAAQELLEEERRRKERKSKPKKVRFFTSGKKSNSVLKSR